tara:strand:- start:180 stop:560 length:381 start_codon:yes stop_codon:yes gene_type:complete
MNVVWVALGGALGAAARYGMMHLVGHLHSSHFPYGTLLVNIVGSLLMGVFIGLMAKMLLGSEQLRLFIAVGFLGGFTTFSAFSLDVVSLFQRDAMMAALLYMLGSVVVSVMALMGGLMLTRFITVS